MRLKAYVHTGCWLLWCTVYLEVVGSEGTDDLRWDAQTWRARQGEAAVQILAAHGLMHQPVSNRENQRVKQLRFIEIVDLCCNIYRNERVCPPKCTFVWP